MGKSEQKHRRWTEDLWQQISESSWKNTFPKGEGLTLNCKDNIS